MQHIDIHCPCGKRITFERQEHVMVCSNPFLLDRLQKHGILHLDGKRYFPKDGEKCLEAIYDFYCLKGLHVEWL